MLQPYLNGRHVRNRMIRTDDAVTCGSIIDMHVAQSPSAAIEDQAAPVQAAVIVRTAGQSNGLRNSARGIKIAAHTQLDTEAGPGISAPEGYTRLKSQGHSWADFDVRVEDVRAAGRVLERIAVYHSANQGAGVFWLITHQRLMRAIGCVVT